MTKKVLTEEALEFLEQIHRAFNKRRLELLQARDRRQKEVQADKSLDFLPETKAIRQDRSWRVANTPKDLQKRWVEITGPTDKKMVINALNSRADVFMADFEDSQSPTWENTIQGQQNLQEAIRRELHLKTEKKEYKLNNKLATLLVRPRGLHLDETHLTCDGEPMSGSFVDFGLYFFHNAQELIKKGSGPYFYLPKIESHLEARLWNELFVFAQNALNIPVGTIRATVLIETIWAAFEMEEILFELKEHSSGLNAGRWDYIFSIIKTFNVTLPNRDQVTMATPFMRCYSQLIVKTCHKRGAHAIGGMAAFIPSRKDPEVNAKALKKVTEDKLREIQDGFDGTWVAHPDLVPLVQDIFAKKMGEKNDQKYILKDDLTVTKDNLLNFKVPDGIITKEGLRHNISVAIGYLTSWLNGVGACAIYNLMEDVATAEISRAQVWQWLHSLTICSDGTAITEDLIKQIIDEETSSLTDKRSQEAKELFETLVFSEDFIPFLTLIGVKKIS